MSYYIPKANDYGIHSLVGFKFSTETGTYQSDDQPPIHHGYDADGLKVYSGGKVIYEIPVSKFPDEILRMAERLRAGKGE